MRAVEVETTNQAAWCWAIAVDALRQDDINSARVLSPKEKLSQALEVMAYGLSAKRSSK